MYENSYKVYDNEYLQGKCMTSVVHFKGHGIMETS